MQEATFEFSVKGTNVCSEELVTINTYMDNGMLVFDDPRVGLVKEALIRGADMAVIALGGKQYKKFDVTFSETYFKQAIAVLLWDSGDVYNVKNSGNYYNCHEIYDVDSDSNYSEVIVDLHSEYRELWLCPALHMYFEHAPKQIFINVKGVE